MSVVGKQSTTSEDLRWNSRLESLDFPHLLQTAQWGRLKASFGWTAYRIETNGGLALVLVRGTPIGPLAYIPRGPALQPDMSREDALACLLSEVHRLCRQVNAVALKIEPPWLHSHESAQTLRSLGFRPSSQTVQPRSTCVVELAGGEQDILGRMKAKTRYNIRLSSRKGVAVRPARAEDMSTFWQMLQETARRDGFGIHPEGYYRMALDLFAPQGMAELLLAEHEGQPLAGLMLFAFAGSALYLYGASTNRHRNLMPTYALQWAAIRWALSRGCHRYDLWGIPDEVGQSPDTYMTGEVPSGPGLWGVWRFKRGFGGLVLRHIGAWDYIYRPAHYQLYSGLVSLFRRIRQ